MEVVKPKLFINASSGGGCGDGGGDGGFGGGELNT